MTVTTRVTLLDPDKTTVRTAGPPAPTADHALVFTDIIFLLLFILLLLT